MATKYRKCVSLVTAWTLAFGCALGWEVFALPFTMFLPISGWLGSSIGLVLGGLVMAVIAWNYHYMINWCPGQGGIYTYISRAFGCDHAFLCAWFVSLAYAAIAWSDVMALGMLTHYMLGSAFHTDLNYVVSGHIVCLNCIILAIVVSGLVAAVCCRKKISGRLQTVFAICFILGLIACVTAAFAKHTGGIGSAWPAFAPTGNNRFMQVIGVMAMAPWLFVGFETISNVSAEFRFSPRKSFGIMVSAIAATAVAYMAFVMIMSTNMDLSALKVTQGPGGIVAVAYHALDVVRAILGPLGSAVIVVTLMGAIFTNLIGNTIASASLISAMAEDGALPAWLGKKNEEGAPRNALIAVSACILFIAPLGASVIDFIVDIAVVCALVAYGYISAATLKVAHWEHNRKTTVFGVAGLVLSVVIALLFVLPGATSGIASVSTGSYFAIIVLCLLGLTIFLIVFYRDHLMRFGRSMVAWTSLLAIMLVMSVLWVRQSTHDITEKAYGNVLHTHARICHPDAINGLPVACATKFRSLLEEQHKYVKDSIMLNNIVQTAITVIAIILMVIIYNILRRREMNLERDKTKAKGYFFSTVSHDIRTPLNAIIGFTEMLRMGMNTEEERKQALDAISVSSKTLLGLINDILDLSKLEAGKMSIAPEPTDCEALLREIMDGFRISSAKPDLEFICDVNHPMPNLMLDSLRIKQIVFNLVGNAAKFTERGHVRLHASYDVLPGDESGIFRFEVEDTGCGISEEDLLRIGRAYVQVGTKRSRNGGTGLGLAICRQLVKAMGGDLSVESNLGKGTTFFVEIPSVKIAPEGAHPENQPVRMDTAIRKSLGIQRILIVDDQKMNCMVMKAILQHVGKFDVVTAMDGKEALDILEKKDGDKFDLVLTDLWMPNLDGEGLVRKIRANPAIASQRVIAVTADVEFTGTTKGAEFDGILYKPVTTAKLSRIIYGGGK